MIQAHRSLSILFRATVYWLLAALSITVSAENNTRFTLLYTDQHETFAHETLKQLQQYKPNLSIRFIPHELLDSVPADSIIITLGKSHLDALLRDDNYQRQAVIASFISRYDFHTTLNALEEQELPITAMFSDPPITRQLDMISHFAESAKVAIVWDENTRYLKTDIAHYIEQTTLDIQLVENRHDNINALLMEPAIISSDFLLASYNPEIYNAQHIKNIVFTLLRRKQGLIGYSSSWVESGAMATTYSDRQAIIRSLSDYIVKIADNNGTIGEPVYPAFFDIKVNNNISQALGFPSIDSTILKNTINQGGGN